MHYDSDSQVDYLVDANGNKTVFFYEHPDGTRVQVLNPQNAWTLSTRQTLTSATQTRIG
jgi:hypothetical protein